MHIRDLQGKKVCILGFGREGQATLRALEKCAPDCDITIADANAELPTTHYPLQTGPNYLKDLNHFDVIIKSPGIPPQPEFDAIKDKITNATQIFLDSVAETGATVIGVTGSKGKSTTASLITEILKAAGKNVYLVGNIGNPALDYVDSSNSNTIFVQEMSSYQLMDLTVSPQIAVVTTVFPEHLDYHGSFEEYKEAKKNIVRFQNPEDVVFYDASSADAAEIATVSSGKHIPFAEQDSPVRLEETNLIGTHNLRNIAAAYKVAQHLEIPEDITIEAIKSFVGLPHRLQSLGVYHGIEWVDDAISTTPESTIAALEALGNRVSTIILGGQDRGFDFTELGKAVANSSVEHVILFPESGQRIQEAVIATQDSPIVYHLAHDMQTAVETAIEHTPEGRICLLSTASPSYNMFKNFEEKGEEFSRCIRKA